MNPVRVKLCGMTCAADVSQAVACGADALGFVMWSDSPRRLDVDRLRALSQQASPFVTRVGLFVDPDAAHVEACLPFLDLLQFHGDEPADFCAHFAKPWVKALRMRDDIDLHLAAERYSGAGALLLDAYSPGLPGGTGETFDWQRIPGDLAKPVILAGGLTPDNVAEAIAQVRPYAVDVSGGIEVVGAGQKGVKDPDRMRAFCDQVAEINASSIHRHTMRSPS